LLFFAFRGFNSQVWSFWIHGTEGELLRARPGNFGRKSTNELKELLATQGLKLGMTDEEMASWISPNPDQPLFRDS
jgi:hypothetical protein